MTATGLSTSEKYRQFLILSSVQSVEPITVERARDALVWSTDGTEYVDCFAGIAVVNAGHCEPRVLEAARRQMERLVHIGSLLYEVPVVADLAEKLAWITPGRLEKTFFCNSGAEAVEGALRLAKASTGRSEFIALELGFHGRTNATLSVTGNRKRKQHGGPYLPGVAFAPPPHPYRCRLCNGKCSLACADAVSDVIDYHTSGDVAAFIAEPVMGEGGIIVPPEGYFERVKKILDDRGILFIADEVQSGFGRTGTMFAIERSGVAPDIMTMAKGIGDGFPLAGFTARPDVADSFRPGEHLSTFGGNPVCCAAGLASIEVLEADGLVARSAGLGSWLRPQLERLAERHVAVGDVRGAGLMQGLELVRDRVTREPAPELAARIKASCRQRGVLIGVGGYFGNVLRIQPPLTITQEQLGFVAEVLDGALSEAMAS
ncbi:aspartate aminotransferase family protein [bacterium]|nr:MAG: aspartate aminotransferase family protein [bacterium]